MRNKTDKLQAEYQKKIGTYIDTISEAITFIEAMDSSIAQAWDTRKLAEMQLKMAKQTLESMHRAYARRK